MRDFLQRVRSRRFPSIELDMKMVLAHCGSLLLDPAAVQEVRPRRRRRLLLLLLSCFCCLQGTRPEPHTPGCRLIKTPALPAVPCCRRLQVYHEMVVLERMHQAPEFSPGASLEALTRRPLRMH